MRSHSRAAGVWAAVAGVLFAVRVVGEVSLIPAGFDAGEGAVVALIFGTMGNAWLASWLLSFSTLMSKRGIPVGVTRGLMYVWQFIVLAYVAIQFSAFDEIVRTNNIPWLLTIFGVAVAVLTIRTMAGRMTEPTPLHWVHVAAILSFAVSTFLLSVFIPSLNGIGIPFGVTLGLALFVFGWMGSASIALFAAGMSLEPFENLNAVWFALGGVGAMTFGVLAGPQLGGFVYSLGLLAYIFSLAYLLKERWYGRFDNWSERLLMAGLLVLFFGIAEPIGGFGLVVFVFVGSFNSFIPSILPILVPSLMIGAYAWSAAALFKFVSTDVNDKSGRLIAWLGTLGIAAPWTIMTILHFDPFRRYDSIIVRSLFAAGELLLALGCLAVSSQLRRATGPPRRRRRHLKSVD